MKQTIALLSIALICCSSTGLNAWGRDKNDPRWGKTPDRPLLDSPARYNIGDRPPEAPERDGINLYSSGKRSTIRLGEKKSKGISNACKFSARKTQEIETIVGLLVSCH